MDSVHLLLININGLRHKVAELEQYTKLTKPDFILINETKLGSLPPPYISGYYTAETKSRTQGRIQGGGVAIYSSVNTVTSPI